MAFWKKDKKKKRNQIPDALHSHKKLLTKGTFVTDKSKPDTTKGILTVTERSSEIEITAQMHLRLLYVKDYFATYLRESIDKVSYDLNQETLLMSVDILLDKVRHIFKLLIQSHIAVNLNWLDDELRHIETLLYTHNRDKYTLYNVYELEHLIRIVSTIYSYLDYEYKKYTKSTRPISEQGTDTGEQQDTPKLTEEELGIFAAISKDKIVDNVVYSNQFHDNFSVKDDLVGLEHDVEHYRNILDKANYFKK